MSKWRDYRASLARNLNRRDCPPGRSLVSVEKAADEISSTGGRRRLSPRPLQGRVSESTSLLNTENRSTHKGHFGFLCRSGGIRIIIGCFSLCFPVLCFLYFQRVSGFYVLLCCLIFLPLGYGWGMKKPSSGLSGRLPFTRLTKGRKESSLIDGVLKFSQVFNVSHKGNGIRF